MCPGVIYTCISTCTFQLQVLENFKSLIKFLSSSGNFFTGIHSLSHTFISSFASTNSTESTISLNTP
ncbi:unnamed protein product [Meloidogyne enterolobii]|uniref:Uncharacterized protein n=1 Tax=Meloidogyne enterolobii TaxID=390850 RepID=A0ACB1A6Q9_MELEN